MHPSTALVVAICLVSLTACRQAPSLLSPTPSVARAALTLSSAAPAVGTCKWRNVMVTDYIDGGGVWPTIWKITGTEYLVFINFVFYPGGPGTTYHIDDNYDCCGSTRWCTLW